MAIAAPDERLAGRPVVEQVVAELPLAVECREDRLVEARRPVVGALQVAGVAPGEGLETLPEGDGFAEVAPVPRIGAVVLERRGSGRRGEDDLAQGGDLVEPAGTIDANATAEDLGRRDTGPDLDRAAGRDGGGVVPQGRREPAGDERVAAQQGGG